MFLFWKLVRCMISPLRTASLMHMGYFACKHARSPMHRDRAISFIFSVYKKASGKPHWPSDKESGRYRTRTYDRPHVKRMLSQLS